MSKILDHPNFQILLNTILSTVKYDSFLTAIFLLAAGDIFKIPPGIQLLIRQGLNKVMHFTIRWEFY